MIDKTKIRYIGGAAAAALILILILVLSVSVKRNTERREQPSTEADVPTESEAMERGTESTKTAEEATESTEQTPPETEPTMLENLVDWYERNPDIAGWLTVENTRIDCPVMYTPEDEEKYIYADFDGHFSIAGQFFIDDACSLDPESDNIIIYGHNMKDGSMFGSLKSYQYESYWKEHPIISFSTLYEEREYEVVSAFYDRVYYKDENCFKFYQFIDAEDEDHFRETMAQFKAKAMYDTGITAEYGDKLIMLVTCSFHVDNGRFVVVAREKK